MKQFLQRFWPTHKTFPQARRRCDMVIVSAASDGEWLGVQDLLDSLATYLDCDYEVVIADDATSDGTYDKLLKSGCWVMRNPQKLYLAGLDLTLRRVFLEAYRLFDSPIYLKIDPDALVIGNGLLEVLKAAFSADPKTGLLGTFQIDWNGEKRDLSFWRERMTRRYKDLGKPYEKAIHHGYQVGDGVQGGAYALSQNCLASIISHGWLNGKDGYQPSLQNGEQIAEDSLIAMLTYAAGFKAKDIGGPGQPFGIWDVGLPMLPDELIKQKRLVTHSIKYHDDASVAHRDYFRQRRGTYRQVANHPGFESSVEIQK